MKAFIIVSVALSLSACASTSQMQLMRSAADNVIVDTKGVDMNKYQQDLSECAEYASRIDVSQNTGNAAVANFNNYSHFMAIIMPVRVFTEKNPDTGLPTWAKN